MVIISDNLTHGTAAVYDYQKIIVGYLKLFRIQKRFINSQAMQDGILKTNIALAIFKLTKQIVVSQQNGIFMLQSKEKELAMA